VWACVGQIKHRVDKRLSRSNEYKSLFYMESGCD
jgi:hypothetical protein